MAVKAPYSRIAPVGPMYRLGMVSGNLTTATGSTTGTMSYSVFSFQWLNTQKVCWITAVNLDWSLVTTFTAAQDVPFGLFTVRSFTVAPTGGTPATLTTATITNALDTSFGPTYFATGGDIRMATTGNLTAGTGVIDKYPMKIWSGGVASLGAGVSTGKNGLFQFGNAPNTQSLALRYQEGFSIQPLITMGAAGVIQLYVTVEWIEMDYGQR